MSLREALLFQVLQGHVFQGGFVVPGAPGTCLSVTSRVSVRRIHLLGILPDVFFEQNTEGNFVKFW